MDRLWSDNTTTRADVFRFEEDELDQAPFWFEQPPEIGRVASVPSPTLVQHTTVIGAPPEVRGLGFTLESDEPPLPTPLASGARGHENIQVCSPSAVALGSAVRDAPWGNFELDAVQIEQQPAADGTSLPLVTGGMVAAGRYPDVAPSNVLESDKSIHFAEPEKSDNLDVVLSHLRKHIESKMGEKKVSQLYFDHCALAKFATTPTGKITCKTRLIKARTEKRFLAYWECCKEAMAKLQLPADTNRSQVWLLLLPTPHAAAGNAVAHKRWLLPLKDIKGISAGIVKKLRKKVCSEINNVNSDYSQHTALEDQLAAVKRVQEMLRADHEQVFMAMKGRATPELLAERWAPALRDLYRHCRSHAVADEAYSLLQAKRCSDALHEQFNVKTAKLQLPELATVVQQSFEMTPLRQVCRTSTAKDNVLAPVFAVVPEIFLLSGAWSLVQRAWKWGEPYSSLLGHAAVRTAVTNWRRKFRDSLRKAPITTEGTLLERRVHWLAGDPVFVARSMMTAWRRLNQITTL